jgi:inhibitor of KinA sporulation pathway (predicted exonuclease)
LRHTIIFDLEATCWEGKSELASENIEVGAVRIDADGRRVDTFQTFVCPTTVPVLSEYCTKLTSIRQEDVADAPSFHEAMAAFEAWMGGDADLVSYHFLFLN